MSNETLVESCDACGATVPLNASACRACGAKRRRSWLLSTQAWYFVVVPLAFAALTFLWVRGEQVNKTAATVLSPTAAGVRLEFEPQKVDGLFLYVDVAISNDNDRAIKDVTIRCDQHGASGTKIYGAEKTLYEIFPKKTTRTFSRVRVGLLEDQVNKVSCFPVQYKPAG